MATYNIKASELPTTNQPTCLLTLLNHLHHPPGTLQGVISHHVGLTFESFKVTFSHRVRYLDNLHNFILNLKEIIISRTYFFPTIGLSLNVTKQDKDKFMLLSRNE